MEIFAFDVQTLFYGHFNYNQIPTSSAYTFYAHFYCNQIPVQNAQKFTARSKLTTFTTTKLQVQNFPQKPRANTEIAFVSFLSK